MASLQGLKLKQVIDPTLAKAFTHPLRGHVWVTICEKGVASPKEIAEETGLDVSEVSYHFRELKRRKLISLVRTEQRRGFAEHFYEPAAPVLEELLAALGSGAFDARNRHLSRTWLTVDEQGWEEASNAVQEALDSLVAIQKRCAARLAESAQPGIPACVAMAFFETSVPRRSAADEG